MCMSKPKASPPPPPPAPAPPPPQPAAEIMEPENPNSDEYKANLQKKGRKALRIDRDASAGNGLTGLQIPSGR